MNLKQKVLTEEQAKEISNWKYEGKYSIYNLPDWETMKKDYFALCDDKKRETFISYCDVDDNLIGFVNLIDEGEYIFFGIGIKPSYCGKGLGKQIVSMAILESENKFGNKPMILEVRCWNKRAINCYKSQGFEIIGNTVYDTYIGNGEFYIMEYNKFL